MQSAAKAKLDVERVLAAAVKRLKLTGKIGVYGRSIGGIAACHLASKYPEIIDVLIVDRSLTEIQGVAESKKPGPAMTMIFDLFSANGWICQNSQNFLKANCFKIMSCDPNDDLIDIFVSIMAGASVGNAKVNYNATEYQLFFESLLFLLQLENKAFQSLTKD